MAFRKRAPSEGGLTRKAPLNRRALLRLGGLSAAVAASLAFVAVQMLGHDLPLTLVYSILAVILVFGGLAIALMWNSMQALARARGRSSLLQELEDGRSIGLAAENELGELIYANAQFRRWFPDVPDGVLLAVGRALNGPHADPHEELKSLRAEVLAGYEGRREISGGVRNDTRWFEVIATPMAGRNIAWQVREATTRRRQMERAGDRLALLSRALDRAPFGIVITDENFLVKEANTAFRRFVSGHPAAGRPFPELVVEEEREALLSHFGRAVQEDAGTDSALDVRLLGDGGRMVTIHATRATFTRGGEAGLLLHIEDATERKRLELQFAQSQKMQAVGQLAGGVAHDFNNMLTAIIGFCDLLLQRHQPGDQSFADTMQIKQNANRAAGLVRQLLAFSRQQTLRPRVLNVTDILAELSILLRRLVGDNIELEMIHGRDLGLVRADQGQIEQVIINLAVNARDAMPDGGRLIIQTDNFTADRPYPMRGEVMPAGDYVMISVTDTGIGIDQEALEHIFEPFFTTKEVGQGTGLGLSMVYGSVRQTGGFVFAHSDGPKKGATFILYLLKADAEESLPAADADSDRDQDDTTGGGHVLLVEDEDPVRLFSARALRSKGYRVMEARTGEAAIEILEDQTFDLLVTDMVMPKVDGATLIAHARTRMPDLPVICISGYTQETVANKVAELPRVHFLPKPFSLKQLARKVKEAIDSP